MHPETRTVRDSICVACIIAAVWAGIAALVTVITSSGISTVSASTSISLESTALPYVTAQRAPDAPRIGSSRRIRCILPVSRDSYETAMLDGVRVPSPFRTPERFGNETIYPNYSFVPNVPSPRPALMNTAELSEPFVPLRNPDNRISMRDELVIAQDYDTGHHRAMVVPNRADPARIAGFVYIPSVWGVRLIPPANYGSIPSMLAEALNRYTDIDARADGHLTLTDRRLFSTPFLYITAADAFELTREERERLGDYLRNGGFVFLEGASLESVTFESISPEFAHGPGGSGLRRMLLDTLGCHARFEPIPGDHPIYNCLFEFPDGAPQGCELRYLFSSTVLAQTCGMVAVNATLPDPVRFLEGIFLDGRLVAVYSAKGYGTKWAMLPGSARNNTPQMKFAANLLVYALTREGGMTGRLMDGFSYSW